MGIESGPKFNPEEQSFGQENQYEEDAESGPETMAELMVRIISEAEKIEIKPEDRNEKGDLLVSPEGAVSNLGGQSEIWWKIARTESFKKFFGDWQGKPKSSSKIVDDNGEPLVVFRGVDRDISIENFYDPGHYEESIDATGSGKGVHVTPSRNVAARFGTEGGIYSLFVNSKRPTEQESPQRGLEGMLDEIFYIPRKYFKLPRFYHGLYDSVLGTNRNLAMADKNVSPESKKLEDLYEMVVRDPNQILIIPNPISRKYKDEREHSQDVKKGSETE